MSHAAVLPQTDSQSYFKGNTSYFYSIGSGVFFIPVNLPHGAVVTQLTLIVYDNDAADYQATLYRKMAFSNSAEVLASVSTGTASTSIVSIFDNSISNATVDNTSYAYYIHLNWPPISVDTNLRFHNALIYYTVTDPLP